MDEPLWKLRYKALGQPPSAATEKAFSAEAIFILAVQLAYRNLATDMVATLPDGRVLTEAALRAHFPAA